MPRRLSYDVFRYSLAIVLVILVLYTKLYLTSLIEIESPFLLFFTAIMISAWYGGFGPGLLATLLSGFIVSYYFLAPTQSWLVGSPGEAVWLIAFFIEGLFISSLNAALRKAKKRAEINLQQAETYQQKLEQLLAELEEAVHFRDNFIATASHELKTPIASLRGFVQLTLHQLKKNLDTPETLSHNLNMIEAQIERLHQYILQLLDVTRVTSDKLELTTAEVNVVEVLRNLIMMMQTTTTKHTIRLQAPDKVLLQADALRLEQVFSNLISNAIRYSPAGGPVEVEVAQSTEDESVQITFTDKGIGIPLEKRANLFSRFYQAHDKGYKGGLGLGLYISRHIIDLHGGTIAAEFPSEGGTRFIVKLPIKVSIAALQDSTVLVT